MLASLLPLVAYPQYYKRFVSYVISREPLFGSSPPPPTTASSAGLDSASPPGAFLAAVYLGSFLILSALGPPTQSRVFGPVAPTGDSFGVESPALDQLVRDLALGELESGIVLTFESQLWSNVAITLMAIGSCVFTGTMGTLGRDVELLRTTPALAQDVALLSAVSAVGSIILTSTVLKSVRPEHCFVHDACSTALL